jgi:NTE family protein
MPGPVRARWSNGLGLAALLGGRWGVTRMKFPGVLSLLPGPLRDVSIQDHGPLAALLGRLVDWDLLNASPVPFTFASVDLEAGAIRWWDTRRDRIGAEHILASTALPPLLPPVAIEGRLYWDGGLGANLPLDPILGAALEGPTVVVASDLYTPEGTPPDSLDGSALRAQDLGFALQSRVRIEALERERRLRREAHPGEPPAILAHLILRPPLHQRALKSLDFSATAIEERAAQGRADMGAVRDRLKSAARDQALEMVRLP